MSSRIQHIDGTWLIARDFGNNGKDNKWQIDIPLKDTEEIKIPGVIQEAYPFYDGVAWFYRNFFLKAEAFADGKYFVDFGAVDYLCEVWLNGKYLGLHEDAEEPFRFDATECILKDGENLLAVRVVNPYEEPIDGITLDITPHRNKANLEHRPGSVLNYGGIICPVLIISEPPIRINEVYVKTDWETGEATFEIAVHNDKEETTDCEISLNIHEVELKQHVLGAHRSIGVKPGESVFCFATEITGYKLWSTEAPFLYCAAFSLVRSENSYESSEKAVCFGYRDFRIENGFFMLNGKRIFLKSAHTGNNLPVGGFTSRNRDLYMKDLYYAKSFGFNMVRFIAGIPFREQLDICDEIGLMVYEECYAGWCLKDSLHMEEYYERSVSNMIKRDRNHPCVTIWGLLNETCEGNVFRNATNFLPKARKLDQSRLILLNSGRFDSDREIYSAANPFKSEWEQHWGYDGSKDNIEVSEVFIFGSTSDIHTYPKMPFTALVKNDLRTVGNGKSKPVFISEFGFGSQNNIIQEYLKFVENGERTDLEDASLYKHMIDRLMSDWEFYNLDGVFIFPEDFLLESMRLNCRQRQLIFDLIRSNPKICGYSITGLLDHAVTGEGLWTYWREFKPGMADILKEGWAPLRWALFSEKRCNYTNKPFLIEAVICNEDILPPGNYPAMFRIKGKDGIVWEKKTEVVLPEEGYAGMPPLAVSVNREEVCIEEPGEYEFGATLLDGGSPLGGRLSISVFEPIEAVRIKGSVAYWGCDDKIAGWMSEHSIQQEDFVKNESNANIVIVGKVGDDGTNDKLWEKLYKKASEGTTVLLLCPDDLCRDENTTANLPFEAKGECVEYPRWLYHLDNIHKSHMVFEGIHDEGIADFEYFDAVYPQVIFSGLKKPSKTICAAIGVGQMIKGGYISGVSLGEYNYGKGKIVLNSFRIIEELGKNPIADRMLRNMIVNYAEELSAADN